jgi:outer membrane receptor protein involved in Fe transport
MNHPLCPSHRRPPGPVAALFATLATAAFAAQPPPPPPPTEDNVVHLSAFEVDASRQRGYFAPDTTAGTRLNSKIEDLAASITVVTKEQMADFAMLDLNDIFRYEASTEGTANYTDVSFNASGSTVDNTMIDPNNANRIRGIGSANIAEGNFETSGRVPVDPSGIDGVEISRGPNSNLFGLGNPSGTVNLVPASANLLRDRAQVQLRGDTFGGYRSSLDVNRVLRRGMLALRGTAVFQHDGYRLKPSGTDTTRLTGMVKFQPFRRTSLTASYSHYRLSGNRPNTSMPRDAITPWLEAGSPTWDPLTLTRYINGVPVQVGGTLATSTGLQTLRQGSGRGESHLFVDADGSIGFWTPGFANNSAAPGLGNPTFYYTQSRRSTLRDTQPLFSTDPVLSNKAFYDWTEINLAAMNSLTERTATTKVQLEHTFFETPVHLLAAQAGWYREDSRNHNRYFYGKPTSNAVTNFINIDTNIRLLNGAPNPYFLRPYISLPESQEDDLPLLRDTYRAQLAYRLQFNQRQDWLRHLGHHQVAGYGEYRDYKTWINLYRDVLLSTHAWAPATDPRGPDDANVIYQNYYHFYVGDNKGNNIDYAPADFRPGTYDYTWGNPPNQTVERAQLGSALIRSSGSGKIQKTSGVMLQSFLLRDRLVTTVGLRNDKNYNRSFGTEWSFNEGRTTTVGAVLKPLPWLALHANKSDSFIPSTLAQDLNAHIVPDPRGEGKDYGFTVSFFSGKLNIRANQYTTRQLNSRNGTSSTIASNLVKLDIDDGAAARGFGLTLRAPVWIRNSFLRQGITPTQAQVDARLAEIMQMSTEQRQSLERLNTGGANGLSQIPLAEPSSLTARGREIEINDNPNAFLTTKLNLTEQETIDGRLAPNIDAYIAQRMGIWQKIIDEDTGQPWFTTIYGTGGSSASSYYTGIVQPRFPIAKATENKSRPQIRKYRVNLLQSVRLAAITEQRHLKRVTLGGALRWEDRGAIGYYGVEKLPAIVTTLDANRPVWDKAHTYVDVFASYRTKIWADKIGLTIQANVRNLQENGRLQPVAAFPDGTPSALRIVDPRQFILTATFDL